MKFDLILKDLRASMNIHVGNSNIMKCSEEMVRVSSVLMKDMLLMK